MLGKDTGTVSPEQLNDYALRAEKIHAAIEQYFGADVEGFHTYRYYEGNSILRAWLWAAGVLYRSGVPRALDVCDTAGFQLFRAAYIQTSSF
jgi:hypothetical protein